MKIDFHAPEFIGNPYPLYDQLRENEPIHYEKDLKLWFFTTYEALIICCAINAWGGRLITS